MSVSDVTNLRKAGKLKEAYNLAKRELERSPDEWTRMSMFWVLRDYAQKVYIPASNIASAKACLIEMGELLPYMIDDSGAGERAYKSLKKQITPNVDIIHKVSELSKTDPNAAYNLIIEKFGSTWKKIDEAFHDDLGWIIYRYIKANLNNLQTCQYCNLLEEYMSLKNTRPSLLHSMILCVAFNFAKGHKDFLFYNFLLIWNVDYFRKEDYEETVYEGHDIPSLFTRICRFLVDKVESFDVCDFVGRFNDKKYYVIGSLQEAYFWKLMNFHKENKMQELWASFDYYVKNYSSFGSSHWHSEILKIANRFMIDENAYRFIDFMREWNGDGNLSDQDWLKEKDDDGNEYPSLAVMSAKKCFEIVKNDYRRKNDNDTISWLKSLYSQVIEHDTNDDWSIRNYATLSLWEGSIDDAISSYKKLLINKGDKYYLWSELADCINDNNLRIGLLLKAKNQERNEDFLGDVHLSLAGAWISESYYNTARRELDIYVKHRNEKGWSVSDTYRRLINDCSLNENNKQQPDFDKYILLAEDYVYSDYEWHNYVLTDKWVIEGKEHCSFYDGESLFFSVKSKRFNILEKAKLGDVFSARCQIVEKKDYDNNFSYWNRKIITTKIVTPLVFKKSDIAPWSLLPEKYGVVDYINEAKNILHILTQDSKQVFCIYKGTDIEKDSFVKFREYVEKHKDETRILAANVISCPREEALSKMKTRVVVVDDVNEYKKLFHVVMGKNLISDTVRFDQTDLRPLIGDFLKITYCIKKNKEGKKHIKFFDIQPTDEEIVGVKGTVTGQLVVKYKYGENLRDQNGKKIPQPDFAFVEDFYIHKNILRKYNIKDDCYVNAKYVLGGDNKWKVYDLEVIDDKED